MTDTPDENHEEEIDWEAELERQMKAPEKPWELSHNDKDMLRRMKILPD